MYSEEEGARSVGMSDPIDAKVKQERFNAVMAQQRDISAEQNAVLVGSTIKVLVDEQDKEGLYYGRTQGDAPDVDCQVIFRSETKLFPGDFADIRIEDSLEYDLLGIRV
jgi:ribosomal protein S12 methylthiotransferase